MPRPETAGDVVALKALLAKATAEAAEHALSGATPVPAERLEELGRLARLIELREDAVTVPPRRWPTAFLVGGTLVLVSLLLFVRLPTTVVELDLLVSQLSFVAGETEAVTAATSVTALGATELRAVRLPSSQPGPSPTRAGAALAIRQARVGDRVGSIGLDPIVVPAGTRVLLEEVVGGRAYRLSLSGVSGDLGASVLGPVRIIIPPGTNREEDYPVPRPVLLTPDSGLVQLDLTLADTGRSGSPFRSPLPVKQLELFRTDQFREGDHVLSLQVPTIRSGTLYFEAIDGHARELRSGEGLRFATSSGDLRELRLNPDGILVRFHGEVGAMSVGLGRGRRSLMPTVFEWLAARHGLSLLWGTTAYVVGLLMTVRGWWRRPL